MPVEEDREKTVGRSKGIYDVFLLRFFHETCHTSGFVTPTSPILRASFRGDRVNANGNIGLRFPMESDHVTEVHAVKLITRQHDYLIRLVVQGMVEGCPHGVRRPLEPVFFLCGLLGCKYVDKAIGELVETVGTHDVPMKARGKELGQHEDALDSRVDAIRNRDVDDAVLPRETYGRFSPPYREGIKPCSPSAAQDDRRHILHAHPQMGLMMDGGKERSPLPGPFAAHTTRRTTAPSRSSIIYRQLYIRRDRFDKKKRGPKAPSRSTALSLVHAFHSTTRRHRRERCLFLRLLGDHGIGGEEECRNGGMHSGGRSWRPSSDR